MWMDCVKLGIETRKQLLTRCSQPEAVYSVAGGGQGLAGLRYRSDCQRRAFLHLRTGETWHGFEGYAQDQYLVDPCKLLLTTPGIDAATGQYTEFGVPATILANFLRENGIVPEKCDLNSILFLLTPAENPAKMEQLVEMLAQFERYVAEDAPLSVVLPTVYRKNEQRYRGYSIRRLCQEMHDPYVSFDVKQLQRDVPPGSLPAGGDEPAGRQRGVYPRQRRAGADRPGGRAHRGGGALPYPPGVLCVVPGEVGRRGAALFPGVGRGHQPPAGLPPELQGSTSRKKITAGSASSAYMIAIESGRFAPALLIYPRGKRYFLR